MEGLFAGVELPSALAPPLADTCDGCSLPGDPEPLASDTFVLAVPSPGDACRCSPTDIVPDSEGEAALGGAANWLLLPRALRSDESSDFFCA